MIIEKSYLQYNTISKLYCVGLYFYILHHIKHETCWYILSWIVFFSWNDDGWRSTLYHNHYSLIIAYRLDSYPLDPNQLDAGPYPDPLSARPLMWIRALNRGNTKNHVKTFFSHKLICPKKLWAYYLCALNKIVKSLTKKMIFCLFLSIFMRVSNDFDFFLLPGSVSANGSGKPK